MNKQELRKKFGSIRKSIDGREEKDSFIASRLQTLIEAYPSVFCYVSFGSEVDTHSIIQNNRDKIYVPYTSNGTMRCRKYLGGPLRADKLGNIALESYGQEGTPALTVVPMLAFDENCFRLGYGGGYYDKYLSSVFTVKIGLAYDEQFCSKSFNELFDVPLDMIITPTKILRR